VTAAGYILGHSHKGRMFQASVHGTFASILFFPMAAQLMLGIYLKMHIHAESLRPWAVRAHGIVGKSYPILAWTQILFGAITFRGYCRGDDLGQCLAHYIMVGGTQFILEKHFKLITVTGKRFYCIRYYHGDTTGCGRSLGTPQWTQSGVLGFLGYYTMGYW
jgi:hypothetical protein